MASAEGKSHALFFFFFSFFCHAAAAEVKTQTRRFHAIGHQHETRREFKRRTTSDLV